MQHKQSENVSMTKATIILSSSSFMGAVYFLTQVMGT